LHRSAGNHAWVIFRLMICWRGLSFRVNNGNESFSAGLIKRNNFESIRDLQRTELYGVPV
jgi:hypothetical protein